MNNITQHFRQKVRCFQERGENGISEGEFKVIWWRYGGCALFRALSHPSDERENHVKDTQSDILSVQDRDNAWLTVPYTGIWNVLIDSHSQSLEHSISYIAA